MSRTDKDMPFWAVAEYYEPEHRWRCPDRPGTRLASDGRPCDLPSEAVRHGRMHMARYRSCTWEPVWSERHYLRYSVTWGPRKIDRRLYWWGPDRAKTRACLTEARKQYNSFHDVEIVERRLQHRHSPGKGWWD
jgi:hypothetical protein